MAFALGCTVTPQESGPSFRGSRAAFLRSGTGSQRSVSRKAAQIEAVLAGASTQEVSTTLTSVSTATTTTSTSPTVATYHLQGNAFWSATAVVQHKLFHFWHNLVDRVNKYTSKSSAQAAAAFEEAVRPLVSVADAAEQVLQQLASPPQPATLSDFLAKADTTETAFAALLSDLSNLAYSGPSVDPEYLLSRHALTLVATSATCGIRASQSFDGQNDDALLPSADRPSHASSSYAHMHEDMLSAGGLSGSQLILPITLNGSPAITPSASMMQLSSPEAVTAALANRHSTAFTATPMQVSDVHWHATGSYASGEECTSSGEWMSGEPAPFIPVNTYAQEAAATAAGGAVNGYETSTSLDAASVAYSAQRLHADELAALSSDGGQFQSQSEDESGAPEGGLPTPPVVMACNPSPPSEWFAADDLVTKTRYFAIQGSTSMEHWQINLQFEPEVFEDLGVRVHRGVYQAALKMYQEFLPLVQQHIASSEHATVCFTGHSLGGSLATVLLLLFVRRGILKPSQLAPVYTFGAPAVFCQGVMPDKSEDSCGNCQLPCEMRDLAISRSMASLTAAVPPLCTPTSPSPPPPPLADSLDGLLKFLGLAEDHVINVMLHKDLVPRAFMCDYTSVIPILQRWWPSFRDHSTLVSTRHKYKALYNFIGKLAVIRPDDDAPFVRQDAHHPLVPDEPALYKVGVPPVFGTGVYRPRRRPSSSGYGLGGLNYSLHDGMWGWDVELTLHLPGCNRPELNAATQHEAILEFMNQPHPLASLSEYGSYGPQGAISRYHNPDNYTQALRRLV